MPSIQVPLYNSSVVIGESIQTAPPRCVLTSLWARWVATKLRMLVGRVMVESMRQNRIEVHFTGSSNPKPNIVILALRA